MSGTGALRGSPWAVRAPLDKHGGLPRSVRHIPWQSAQSCGRLVHGLCKVYECLRKVALALPQAGLSSPRGGGRSPQSLLNLRDLASAVPTPSPASGAGVARSSCSSPMHSPPSPDPLAQSLS